MNKQKALNSNKKELSPVAKGFLIAIGYFLLFSLLVVSISMAFGLRYELRDIVKAIAAHLFSDRDFWINDSTQHISYTIVNGIVEAVQSQSWIILLASALSLAVILMILINKKSATPSPEQKKKFPFMIVISAIVIGLGVGALSTGAQGLIYKLIVWLVEVLHVENLSDPFFDFYFFNSSSNNIFTLLKVDIVDAIVTGAFSHAPNASLTAAIFILHALTCSIVFYAGVLRNFQKKLPLFLSLLFCSVLYACLGASHHGMICSLVLGFFMAVAYIKSNSLLPVAIMSGCSGLFRVLTIILQSLFGEYSLTRQFPFGVRIDSAYVPRFESYLFNTNSPAVEEVYNTVSTVYCIALVVLAVLLLIVGIILLLIVKQKKKDPTVILVQGNDSRADASPESQSSPVVEDTDPFADI